MRNLTHALLGLALLAAPEAALAQQNTTPPTVSLGSYNQRDGLSRPVEGVAILNPDGTAASLTVTGRGGSSLITGQVSVGTSATLIAAARTGRQKIGVSVVQAVQCAFGGPGVTLATGWPLPPTAYTSDNWDTAAALYGVCATAATTVGYREQY